MNSVGPWPTVAAVATAPGDAGVAIIRVSGSQSWALVKSLWDKPASDWQPGRVQHGWLLDVATNNEPVDEVLLLPFKAPNSFTGEDVVEIHCHGGQWNTRRVLDLVLQAGAEPAPPGEFTKRAFLNNKLDLTQAESILDLVSARSDGMLRAASSNLKNRSLATYLASIRQKLVPLQADLVACVDFPDEVDEPERAPLAITCQEMVTRLEALESAAKKNQLLREGLTVAILGMPNSGKSSLFNALLAQERAIVTPIAGTTRDILTETLLIRGVPVTLVDTAGIRQSDQVVEMMGIERSWQAADDAHAVMYVYDASVGLRDADTEILGKLRHPRRVLIANKQDCLTGPPAGLPGELIIATAVPTGQGLPEVMAWLEDTVQSQQPTGNEAQWMLNRRQQECLTRLLECLQQAHHVFLHDALPLDLATLPLTDALRHLDALTGQDATEAVLDSVFSRFCVGK